MLPIFLLPPPPPEDAEIPVAETDPVSILTIESFRGLSGQKCCELLEALEENNAARIRDICTELRAALSVRCHYEDQSVHPTLTAIAHELAAHMCAFGALPIPPEHFPPVRVGSPEEFLKLFGTENRMCYNSIKNTIMVHTQHIRSDGHFPLEFYEGLGEELGHFLRAEISREVRLPRPSSEGTRGWVCSLLVVEFYGYMGRRMLQEALRGSLLEPICFPSGTCENFNFLPELRDIRTALRTPSGDPLSQRERRERRKAFLTHARGYSFAQMIDMNRITNWHAFFALPESGVRRRFFRKDQDYRGL